LIQLLEVQFGQNRLSSVGNLVRLHATKDKQEQQSQGYAYRPANHR